MYKKLLIIGAGIGQVPLLKLAKSKGIHVTVATIPGNYPCIELADDVIYKNIYDRDGIVQEAVKRGISAVISDQNDLMNPTVAYVAEKLCLPGNRFDTVMTYCNKNLFRNFCDKCNVPVPKHISIDSENFDISKYDLQLPWIVKPADSQSSIAVKRINTVDELYPALKEALSKSPTHNAILEEFFYGQEVVCEGFVENGNYYLLSFGDRKYFDLNNLSIPCQTLFPSNLDINILNKIEDFERRLAKNACPNFGIVHSEYLVDTETGEIRIVESALRGGGVYISSDLMPLATGININEVLLDFSLGYNIDMDSVFSKKMHNASGYICFYLPDGIISEVSGIDDIKSFPFVHNAYLDDIYPGKKTEIMTYKGARKGPILVYGNNRENLENNIELIQNTLKITVVDLQGNKQGIIWK